MKGGCEKGESLFARKMKQKKIGERAGRLKAGSAAGVLEVKMDVVSSNPVTARCSLQDRDNETTANPRGVQCNPLRTYISGSHGSYPRGARVVANHPLQPITISDGNVSRKADVAKNRPTRWTSNIEACLHWGPFILHWLTLIPKMDSTLQWSGC